MPDEELDLEEEEGGGGREGKAEEEELLSIKRLKALIPCYDSEKARMK